MGKKLNFRNDLNYSDRQYLKGQELPEKEFNKLDSLSQHEWKRECDEKSYGKNYIHSEAVGQLVSSFYKGPSDKQKKIWSKQLKVKRSHCKHIFPATNSGELIPYCEKCGLHTYEINNLSIKRIAKVVTFAIKEMFYVINRFKQSKGFKELHQITS